MSPTELKCPRCRAVVPCRWEHGQPKDWPKSCPKCGEAVKMMFQDYDEVGLFFLEKRESP